MHTITRKVVAVLHYVPSLSKVLLMFTMMILAVSCTSGKDNPVDSHPGSGSFKGGSDTIKEKNPPVADTTSKDSADKK
jgi:hypothetical protein